eukprot:ANDGO_01835.mRNA.1 Glutaminase A
MRYFLVLQLCLSGVLFLAHGLSPLRPPAVPLVVSDPFVSIWSTTDNLYDSWPQHWSGATTALTGLIRIDGSPFRFMGPDDGILPNATMQQTNVSVFPTRTVYEFQRNGVGLTVTFNTPSIIKGKSLGDDADMLSRGVTYVDFETKTLDGAPHSVSLYFDMTSELVVNDVSTPVVWNRVASSTVCGFTSLRMGSEKQPVLDQAGDAVRISWGYVYLSTTNASDVSSVFSGSVLSRSAFGRDGSLPKVDDNRMPRACSDNWPVMALVFGNMDVSATVSQQRWIMLNVDDQFSVKYFGQFLPPFWKYLFGNVERLICTSISEHDQLQVLSKSFDLSLLSNLESTGGASYATLGGLTYRQVTGATKLTFDADSGRIRFFMKEISSDGDIQTVDVIYPASPFFLYLNPQLLTLQLLPIFEYALNMTSDPYPLVWAPHHLGTYPICDILPSQQENMPVEETANMILMLAAIAQKDSYSAMMSMLPEGSWGMIEQWAQYLWENTLDTENQLCTDDFEGPSAHNANLAAKGIVAMGAFAYLAHLRGDDVQSLKFVNMARNYSSFWEKYALDSSSSGPAHYKLQYDKPNSWSLKYNLAWDLVLGTAIFRPEVVSAELDYYFSQHTTHYGLPLDVRSDYAKFDWCSWVAAMSPDPTKFSSVMDSLLAYANETPSRVPLSDWYFAHTSVSVGFRSRSVVGGLYLKQLVSSAVANNR